MEDVQKRRRSIEERNRIKQKRRQALIRKRRMRSLLLFIIMMIPFIVTGESKASEKPESITIQVNDVYMIEDQETPIFDVDIICTGDDERIIDSENQVMLKNLILELENGNGYNIYTETDGTLEGDYDIKISLDESCQESLLYHWLGNVTICCEGAVLHVENKYGQWQENQFLDYDGNQVKDQFIEVKGETYYLDEQGKPFTGVMRLGLIQYTFDTEGVLIQEAEGIDPEQPMIAITLDDGPGAYTDRVLDVLEAYNSHATFFMVGSNVSETYASELQRMVALGCELGNHTTNHPNLNNLSASQISTEMETTNRLITELAGQEPTVMRPPYGSANSFVAENVGLPMVFWNVDTLDWKTKDVDQIVQHILENAADGDIILLHDIHETSVEALEIAIPLLVEQGYQLVTVSELAEARGVELVDGGSYYSFPTT